MTLIILTLYLSAYLIVLILLRCFSLLRSNVAKTANSNSNAIPSFSTYWMDSKFTTAFSYISYFEKSSPCPVHVTSGICLLLVATHSRCSLLSLFVLLVLVFLSQMYIRLISIANSQYFPVSRTLFILSIFEFPIRSSNLDRFVYLVLFACFLAQNAEQKYFKNTLKYFQGNPTLNTLFQKNGGKW